MSRTPPCLKPFTGIPLFPGPRPRRQSCAILQGQQAHAKDSCSLFSITNGRLQLWDDVPLERRGSGCPWRLCWGGNTTGSFGEVPHSPGGLPGPLQHSASSRMPAHQAQAKGILWGEVKVPGSASQGTMPCKAHPPPAQLPHPPFSSSWVPCPSDHWALHRLHTSLFTLNFLRSLPNYLFHRKALTDTLPRSDTPIKCSHSPMEHSINLLIPIHKLPFSM